MAKEIPAPYVQKAILMSEITRKVARNGLHEIVQTAFPIAMQLGFPSGYFRHENSLQVL
jgi:hypothetical protein